MTRRYSNSPTTDMYMSLQPGFGGFGMIRIPVNVRVIFLSYTRGGTRGRVFRGARYSRLDAGAAEVTCRRMNVRLCTDRQTDRTESRSSQSQRLCLVRKTGLDMSPTPCREVSWPRGGAYSI